MNVNVALKSNKIFYYSFWQINCTNKHFYNESFYIFLDYALHKSTNRWGSGFIIFDWALRV